MQLVATLGIGTLKPEQEEAISQFLQGRDVFVALPTGYGKRLCYFVCRSFSTESEQCQPVNCVGGEPSGSTNERPGSSLLFARTKGWFC